MLNSILCGKINVCGIVLFGHKGIYAKPRDGTKERVPSIAGG